MYIQYVCTYVHMYVCMCVCMYTYICMYVCMYTYICMYVCMYVCMYTYILSIRSTSSTFLYNVYPLLTMHCVLHRQPGIQCTDTILFYGFYGFYLFIPFKYESTLSYAAIWLDDYKRPLPMTSGSGGLTMCLGCKQR